MYSSSYFKSLSTGGNVSKALVNKFRKSSINPPGGGGACLFQTHLRGGLIETGVLTNLAKTMVSVLHKELEYKVERLKYKKVGGHAAEDQKQIRTSSW